uniref:Uncharacterized protein n=1 Tax=Romanomermis culicivorax TaxID=13658 RepID=A0A915L8I5_ROMCU
MLQLNLSSSLFGDIAIDPSEFGLKFSINIFKSFLIEVQLFDKEGDGCKDFSALRKLVFVIRSSTFSTVAVNSPIFATFLGG